MTNVAPSPSHSAVGAVEVFSDIGCPFAHVGLRRLVDERVRRGLTDRTLRLRAWPLELVNGAPLDADAVAEKVDVLRREIAPDLFAGFRPSHFPVTTIPALAFTAAATAIGPDYGEAVGLALRNAVFEEGRDVADPSVLEHIAAACGLPGVRFDFEQVMADHADGWSRGVVGSPHFFVAGQDFFCPSLDIRHDDGDLHIGFDQEGFAALVDAALGT